MNKLVTAVALATLIASPAFAQSFDPHLGSGNIVRPIPGATGALARRHAPPRTFGAFASTRPAARLLAPESALFERAKRHPHLY
jgi:hypothetical protein